MPKQTFYFSHDYHARTDKKMIRLLAKEGVSAVGIYWCIIEMLYEEGGYILLSECDCIADELRTDCERISNVVNGYKLFENDGLKFWSVSALNRIELKNEKSKKARESVANRWNKKYEPDTNVDEPYYDTDTIKEKKVNKIKVNKNKDIRDVANATLYQNIVEYWLKVLHPGWTFTGQQGKAVNSIISKIKKVLNDADGTFSDDAVLKTFQAICSNLPEWYSGKDLSVIDSKFNELLTEIKNKGNGKPIGNYEHSSVKYRS